MQKTKSAARRKYQLCFRRSLEGRHLDILEILCARVLYYLFSYVLLFYWAGSSLTEVLIYISNIVPSFKPKDRNKAKATQFFVVWAWLTLIFWQIETILISHISVNYLFYFWYDLFLLCYNLEDKQIFSAFGIFESKSKEMWLLSYASLMFDIFYFWMCQT